MKIKQLLNFKYFGFAIKPEIMSYYEGEKGYYGDIYGYDGGEYYGPGHDYQDNHKYINANIKKTVLAYTPVIYIHVPFVKAEDFALKAPVVGLIASAGYRFLPDLKANAGFEFNIGVSCFW